MRGFLSFLWPFSATSAVTVFDDSRKTVIRGAMDKWESEGGNPAEMVREALWEIFHEDWNIVIYNTCVAEKGYGTWFHYHNKWRIYGVHTSNTNNDKAKLDEFMTTEFGWANIADIEQFQAAAEKRVNANFEGNWKVHVVKLGSGSRYGNVYGTYWNHDGHECIIMRES
jgi:hypothetical protein